MNIRRADAGGVNGVTASDSTSVLIRNFQHLLEEY